MLSAVEPLANECTYHHLLSRLATYVSFIPYFRLLVFGHFSCVIFFPFFFHLAHLALQNVNKDCVIFSYFQNFVAKSDQKPKTKNGMNKTFIMNQNEENTSRGIFNWLFCRYMGTQLDFQVLDTVNKL